MSSKQPINEDINCVTVYMSLEFTKEVGDEVVHIRNVDI